MIRIWSEKIKGWFDKNLNLSEYCRDCGDYCCNTRNHVIWFEGDRALKRLFRKEGVKTVKSVDMNSFLSWIKKHGRGVLHTEKGIEVPKPSLIEFAYFWNDYKDLFLYTDDFCPFYEKGIGCRIYDNKHRPQNCRRYPVNICEGNNPPKVFLIGSCPATQRGLLDRFKESFPDVEVEVKYKQF